MISYFDSQNLDRLLKDFYLAVGIRISIFDDEFNLVCEYPKEAPEFCKLIRSSEEGREGCKNCDKEACTRAKKMRKPHIYTCHAGITEAITPIQIGGGVLGYAILAHMLPEENYDSAVENACALAVGYGVMLGDSKMAIKGIAKKSKEQINAAVSILDAIASYVYIQNLAKWKNEDISKNIDKYIKENLDKQISSDDICKQFNCSRTALYNISMQSFGKGIMQYINYCRIEKAKALLAEGKSITETSEECGFSEYNYFCKVFRKYVGLSPRTYVKSKYKK
jgi:AraC-like DNA-binding protein